MGFGLVCIFQGCRCLGVLRSGLWVWVFLMGFLLGGLLGFDGLVRTLGFRCGGGLI